MPIIQTNNKPNTKEAVNNKSLLSLAYCGSLKYKIIANKKKIIKTMHVIIFVLDNLT